MCKVGSAAGASAARVEGRVHIRDVVAGCHREGVAGLARRERLRYDGLAAVLGQAETGLGGNVAERDLDRSVGGSSRKRSELVDGSARQRHGRLVETQLQIVGAGASCERDADTGGDDGDDGKDDNGGSTEHVAEDAGHGRSNLELLLAVTSRTIKALPR